MKEALIIDDEDYMLRCLTSTLMGTGGYEVSTASDAIEALRFLNDNKIDLIIVDITMPDADGLDFIRNVRSVSSKSVKIIAISGGGIGEADAYLSLALKLGADEAIRKPFDSQEILEVEKVFS